MSGRVLVAGARGGIGASVMEALAAEGCAAYGVDRDDVDVTRPGGAESAVRQASERLGGLDGIVHAIGMSGRGLGDGPITDCTDQAWTEVHRVNHESVFRLLRAGIPELARGGGGSIVVVGSALATTLADDFLTVAYASAKGALVPLVRSAAYEAARSGVRINIVAPGLVNTPMAQRALGDPDITRSMAALQPLSRRALEPAEVAAAILWLLSDAARTMTGAVLPADGGWTLR
ncbi:SDR family NAD(P)-dependent oxidoreductase [Nonomuraea basaltis]|uniref:SDR family NAD(P)-dependent oxidoreductase n=1 Tax=Nonomuraea TaxID=83681 RepID=UPI00110C5703|nr:SDR family oxidoreductase [Nonomuraea basaltis]TMR97377.1 SDR family oxidoreductase [Nonomuraea basaltis]